MTTTIPRPCLEELIRFVAALRPDWTDGAIREALRRTHVTARPWPAVVVAAIHVAVDPASTGPGRIAADGPWWRSPTAEPPARTGRSQPPAFQPGSLRPTAPGDTAAGLAAARAELAKRMTSTGQETS